MVSSKRHTTRTVTREDLQCIKMAEVADLTGMSMPTLYRWALTWDASNPDRQTPPRGPRALKVGGVWRYRLRDVSEWLDSLSPA